MSLIRKFAGLVFAGFLCLAGAGLGRAADRHRSGREIFLQQCSKCHGRSGEGVKGKYEGPIKGERPLDKLTRYIERNMPDDDPGKCTGEDAAAVARYIYDNFYSREARLRSNKAPRIELVRLTNRQYLNSVADLLQTFTGGEVAQSSEHGLRAAYYNSKGFGDGKKLIERIDRTVDFDYGTNSPDPKLDGTNGFSIQWHGSLKADETGEYEIILKTPNGARLWLNDDNEPLIDAWVASGTVSEHKASLRLIEGRLYPLKIDFFKFKQKEASISLEWVPPHGAQQSIPSQNLSPAHSSSIFVVSTPFPPDDSSLGYERGVSISKAWDEAATSAAIEVANYVSTNLDRFSHSKPSDTNRAARVESFCNDFAATAFHRPLSDVDKRLFVSSQFKKAAKTEDAVKRVVLLSLKAPQFLYLGLDDIKQDDFEVAARLSYGMWDSLPDQQLLKLAGEKALHTPQQVADQARRMIRDPRTHAKVLGFFHHWLQMDRVENLSKDDKIFPGFTPAIISDLRASLNLFLEDTMWGHASDYRQLLLADYLFMNNRLAQFYGVSTNETDEFAKVTVDSQKRSGVLTHPYLLAAFSYQKLTSPIHRGVFLTRNIVGRSLKPPPMAMTFKDADFAPNLTMRQKVTQLTRPQACQSCHSVINPLGFSLEQFDAVGRFRTAEQDNPVDPVSDYLTDDGEKIHLAGARDIAEYAISSEQAQNTFIEQMFHHIVKQPMLAYGPDTVTRLRQRFVDSDFNMQKLLVEIVSVSALRGSDKPGTAVATSASSARK